VYIYTYIYIHKYKNTYIHIHVNVYIFAVYLHPGSSGFIIYILSYISSIHMYLGSFHVRYIPMQGLGLRLIILIMYIYIHPGSAEVFCICLQGPLILSSSYTYAGSSWFIIYILHIYVSWDLSYKIYMNQGSSGVIIYILYIYMYIQVPPGSSSMTLHSLKINQTKRVSKYKNECRGFLPKKTSFFLASQWVIFYKNVWPRCPWVHKTHNKIKKIDCSLCEWSRCC